MQKAEEKNMSLVEDLYNSKVVDTTADGNQKSGSGKAESNPGEEDKGSNNVEVSVNGFDAKEIINSIEIVQSYNCDNEGYHELVLILKNNSNNDCNLDFSIDFYDSNKKIVDTQTSQMYPFASNSEAALQFVVDDPFETYEYKFTVSQVYDWVACITNSLKLEVETAKDKAIISVTNNSNYDADVYACTLFLKNDNLVYFSSCNIGDKDYVIKPGTTERNTAINSYGDFDNVKVYIIGSGKK